MRPLFCPLPCVCVCGCVRVHTWVCVCVPVVLDLTNQFPPCMVLQHPQQQHICYCCFCGCVACVCAASHTLVGQGATSISSVLCRVLLCPKCLQLWRRRLWMHREWQNAAICSLHLVYITLAKACATTWPQTTRPPSIGSALRGSWADPLSPLRISRQINYISFEMQLNRLQYKGVMKRTNLHLLTLNNGLSRCVSILRGSWNRQWDRTELVSYTATWWIIFQ